MENLSGNYSGEMGEGVNPEDFKVVEAAEPNTVEIKETAEYTPLDKKTNLKLAALSARTAKGKGLKLNSLERGTGFAS